MADIFKLIGMRVERPVKKAEEEMDDRVQKRINLDDFIIGDDERRYQNDKKSKAVDADFDEEIGIEKDKKDYLKDINKLDFIELNRLPDKKQSKELKKEYLNLLDRLEEMTHDIAELDKKSKSMSMKLHQNEKQNVKLKDLARQIASRLPDGSDLKRTLDNASWDVVDIEQDFLDKIKFVVERAKNADVYVEEQTKEIRTENKNLKRKLIQLESEKTKLEEDLRNAQSRPQVQSPPPPVRETSPQAAAEAVQNGRVPAPQPKAESKPQPKPATPAPRENPAPQPKPQTPAPRLYDDVSDDEDDDTFVPPPIEPQKQPEAPAAKPEEDDDEPEYELDMSEFPDEEEDEVDSHILLDVDRYVETLSDAHKYVIQVVGETGISRNQELKTFLEKDEKGKTFFTRAGKFSYQEMSAATKGLKDGGFFLSEKVDLGSKGGYNFQVFELSDIGKAIYKNVSGKNPSVPEKKHIMDQHKSIQHGYLIKDCSTEFKEMGYEVLTERKDLRFDLPDGKRKDFDFIIMHNDSKCHIEVERGTHTDEDFFAAMDKILQVMQQQYKGSPAEFYFICPNEEILFGKTKRQFFLWFKSHGGAETMKGKVVVHFATFDKVKKRGKWETIWETIKF